MLARLPGPGEGEADNAGEGVTELKLEAGGGADMSAFLPARLVPPCLGPGTWIELAQLVLVISRRGHAYLQATPLTWVRRAGAEQPGQQTVGLQEQVMPDCSH